MTNDQARMTNVGISCWSFPSQAIQEGLQVGRHGHGEVQLLPGDRVHEAKFLGVQC